MTDPDDDAWLPVNAEVGWLVTFHDGTTEEQHGTLWVAHGVMYIQQRTDRSEGLHSLHMYPLTSVRKWEYVG
jgi:hypothetical protein